MSTGDDQHHHHLQSNHHQPRSHPNSDTIFDPPRRQLDPTFGQRGQRGSLSDDEHASAARDTSAHFAQPPAPSYAYIPTQSPSASTSYHHPESAARSASRQSITSTPQNPSQTIDISSQDLSRQVSSSSSRIRPVVYQSPSYAGPVQSDSDLPQPVLQRPTMSNTADHNASSSGSGSGSGSGSRSSLDSDSHHAHGQSDAAALNVPSRPSITQTESTRPLVGPDSPTSPMTSPHGDPFFAIPLAVPSSPGQGQDAGYQSLLAPSAVPGSGHVSAASSSPSAPKIRLNDSAASPSNEDASEVPSALPIFTPPNYGTSAHHSSPAGRNGSISSPFSNPLRLRASAGSLPPLSPRGAFGRSSATDLNPAHSPTTNTIPLSPLRASTTSAKSFTQPEDVGTAATKASIAARRAMRAKQAQSLDAKGNRNSNAQNSKNPSLNRKPFQSTRLKGEIYKPWLEQKDPALRWARWITLASIVIGFAVAAIICWNGYASVPSLGKTCIVLNDDFSSGSIDSSIWQHEVRLDGYGYGSFQWTTSSTNNSFVQDKTLYLVPTLTSDQLGMDAITNGYTLNLTTDGTCTSTNVSQCVAVSNSSQLTVINPVQSARLITKNAVNIKYGKVEVRAKFPSGDWLWPRIMMLPTNDTYGVWPRSGQIDILQGRGNNASYSQRGFDYAQSDLHWGPTSLLDRLYLTWGYREQRRVYYSQKYHTFGLEWNEDFLWTYIDSRVSQVISLRFAKESFWTRGVFPSTYTNTTTGDVVKLTNPWIQSGNNVAPFDQEFYLAIDLAIGSTDGWFPDGEGGKPWLDDSVSAMSDFWAAKAKWWDSSWSSDATKRGFAIDSVKVWKTC